MGESVWDAMNGQDLGTSIASNTIGEFVFMGGGAFKDALAYGAKALTGEAVQEGMERAIKGQVSEAAEESGERTSRSLRVNDDPGLTCSFTPETRVATHDGSTPIGELEVGDKVLAYDEDTDTTDEFEVSAVHVNEDSVLVFVEIDGELVETTPEHPFYTEEDEWVAAEDLLVGDHIRKADGTYGVVESVEILEQTETMYNLTVEEAHTFFVGEGEWLVHNKCYINDITLGNRLIKPNWTFNPRDVNPNSGSRPDQRLASNLGHARNGSVSYSEPDVVINGRKVRFSPHHIVPWNSPHRLTSLAILHRYGIDENSAANGVWVPTSVADADLIESAGYARPLDHEGLHTWKERNLPILSTYMSHVALDLEDAESQAIDAWESHYGRGTFDPNSISTANWTRDNYILPTLGKIANQILDGTYPR